MKKSSLLATAAVAGLLLGSQAAFADHKPDHKAKKTTDGKSHCKDGKHTCKDHDGKAACDGKAGCDGKKEAAAPAVEAAPAPKKP